VTAYRYFHPLQVDSGKRATARKSGQMQAQAPNVVCHSAQQAQEEKYKKE